MLQYVDMLHSDETQLKSDFLSYVQYQWSVYNAENNISTRRHSS
jgi:hypothetical protein